MSVKIRVQNFQSIEDATVEIKGLTVITGQNNAGKSALQRAFRGVFQNTKGSAFVRHGHTKSMVTVDFKDHSVYWEKGTKSKPTYIVDNGEILHPGQAVPSSVADLGVHPISAGNRDVWPQFAPQFTGQIFLLDQPGSVLAEAVADVDRVKQLNQALRLSESARRKAESTLKVRLVDKKSLDDELSFYDGVDGLFELISEIEGKKKQIDRIEKAIKGVQQLFDRFNKASKAVEYLSSIENILLPDTDAVDKLVDSVSNLNDISMLYDHYSKFKSVVDSLSSVSDIDVPVNIEDLISTSDIINQLIVLDSNYKKQVSEIESLKNIGGVISIPDVSKLDKLVSVLDVVQSLTDKLIRIQDKIQGFDSELAIADSESVEAKQAVDTYLNELGQCPVCNSVISD